MCDCNSQSYKFLFSDQFVNTFFWKSAIWYFIAQWTLRWQRKYPQMKTESSFLRNFLVRCEFISQSYTYVSWSSPFTLSFRNLRRASLYHIEPTRIKEISSVQNVKEAFWETSFWSVSSSHWFTTSASRRSLLTLFSWNLQSDIWEPIGAHGDKGNILT